MSPALGGGGGLTQAELLSAITDDDTKWQGARIDAAISGMSTLGKEDTLQAQWWGSPESLQQSKPNHVGSSSTGSAAGTHGDEGFLMSTSATAADYATVFAHPTLLVALPDILFCYVYWIPATDIGQAGTDYPVIGGYASNDPDAAATDIAVFNPGAGNSTSGNIRVDNNGTDTDGSIDYGDYTQPSWYGVVIDVADGETRFYIDKFEHIHGEAAATATIAATPTFGQTANRSLGIGVNGGNSTSPVGAAMWLWSGMYDETILEGI